MSNVHEDRLFHLLDTPGSDPDDIAEVAVRLFRPVIEKLIPIGFTGPSRGAGIIDLQTYTKASQSANIQVYFATEDQLQQAAAASGFAEILDVVRAANPLLDLVVVVLLPGAMRVARLTKETLAA
jgi:hypothetical protein